jgi:hypothetical protein
MVSDSPEDIPIVVTEVICHLAEIDDRQILDPHELAQAWLEVRLCDAAVLDVLTEHQRLHYQAIVEGPRRSARQPRGSDRSTVVTGVVRLHLAIHRRRILLQDLEADW